MIARAALQKRILAVLATLPPSSAARFITVDGVWGFKFYSFEALGKSPQQLRDDTLALQLYTSRFGLAPKVGRPENLVLAGVPTFGYYTRLIVPYDAFVATADLAKLCEEHQQAIVRLRQIGLELNDVNVGNFGRMPDGRLVLYDFSHCSRDPNFKPKD